MLKREITFEDFNGDTVTEVHYFNLTKTELTEMNAQYEGGIERNIMALAEAKDQATIIEEVKKLILMSYGEKTPDGKRFIKTEELRTAFSQSAAYDALFMEMAVDDKAAIAFFRGLLPRDLAEQLDQEMGQDLKDATAEALGVKDKTTAELAAEQG